MGRFVIVMPAISYARELWRFGEHDLARRAIAMTADECADIGERAGELSLSAAAERLWPDGPSGHTSAILVAAIEHLEGSARPASRRRRAPEKSLPAEWHVSEEVRWEMTEPVSREMDARLRRERTELPRLRRPHTRRGGERPAENL